MVDASQEFRDEYMRINPNNVRFLTWTIRLNFAKDIVYMDALTLVLFNLWLENNTAPATAANCRRFHLIQRLETSLATNNINGLTTNPWFNNQTFLAGVTTTSIRAQVDFPAGARPRRADAIAYFRDQRAALRRTVRTISSAFCLRTCDLRVKQILVGLEADLHTEGTAAKLLTATCY